VSKSSPIQITGSDFPAALLNMQICNETSALQYTVMQTEE